MTLPLTHRSVDGICGKKNLHKLYVRKLMYLNRLRKAILYKIDKIYKRNKKI